MQRLQQHHQPPPPAHRAPLPCRPHSRAPPHPTAAPPSVLDGRALAVVPPAIGRLTDLTKLWLSNNGIRTVSPEVTRLVNLDSL
jgi:Leucine-rich repeat (LRR) protein